MRLSADYRHKSTPFEKNVNCMFQEGVLKKRGCGVHLQVLRTRLIRELKICI